MAEPPKGFPSGKASNEPLEVGTAGQKGTWWSLLYLHVLLLAPLFPVAGSQLFLLSVPHQEPSLCLLLQGQLASPWGWAPSFPLHSRHHPWHQAQSLGLSSPWGSQRSLQVAPTESPPSSVPSEPGPWPSSPTSLSISPPLHLWPCLTSGQDD